jgi:hypothetical protein
MNYEELLERVAGLEEENQVLAYENEKLRKRLAQVCNACEKEVSISFESGGSYAPVLKDANRKNDNEKELLPLVTSVHKFSTEEEKIALFLSLFRGRTDVYAKRCYSKKHDSTYYMPACKNEFAVGICERPRIKCKDCRKREFLVFAEGTVRHHLSNKDVHGAGIVGVYPLLSDETCFFLVVDFDEAHWQKDIGVFRAVCEENAIPVSVERSRSGNGGHAWIFFSEAVPAVKARKLGAALLTEAMTLHHELHFSSYDRMFPNQDTMPKGGFGNLIALPLQGAPRKNGNSVF